MPDSTSDLELAGFLDTNVLIRHIMQDNLEHSTRATQLVEPLEDNVFNVCITDTVIFETVFTLGKFYRIPRAVIARIWLDLLELPTLIVADKDLVRETLDLWVERHKLSYADCFHLLSARAMGSTP